MIQQKQENHNVALLSSDNDEELGGTGITREETLAQPASQPARRRTACLPASRDLNENDCHPSEEEVSKTAAGLASFNDLVQQDYEDQPYFDPRAFTWKEIEEETRRFKRQQEEEKPRLVTRGPHTPHHDTPLPQKTILDTLRITAEEPVSILQELMELACPNVSFIPRKSGTNGYVRGYNIVLNGQDLGTLCYGAPHNERQNLRPQLDIGGNGKCQKINWQVFYHYLLLLEKPAIKQVHVALDMFNGELTIEQVEQAHRDLKFQSKKANRNPIITPYGTIQPDGRNPGRSRYIGSLQSSKFIRFYEKSYQLFKGPLAREKDDNQSSFIKNIFNTDGITSIDGYNENKPFDIRKWLRAEIELKDGNCVIALDIIINPDKYFVGAYPFCEELLQMTDGKRPERMKTEEDLTLEIRILNMQAIAGSLIDDLIYLGYTNDQIIDKLRGGKGPSQKLIRSGILSFKAPQDE